MYKIWSEWDIGHENIVFLLWVDAYLWLERKFDKNLLNEVGYDNFDQIFADRLLTIEEIEVYFDQRTKKHLNMLIDSQYKIHCHETDYDNCNEGYVELLVEPYNKYDLVTNLSHTPEDAIWDRDLQDNFYTGIAVAKDIIFNMLKEGNQNEQK